MERDRRRRKNDEEIENKKKRIRVSCTSSCGDRSSRCIKDDKSNTWIIL